MNVVKFFETLAKIISEREGVNVKVEIKRKESDEEWVMFNLWNIKKMFWNKRKIKTELHIT